MDDCKAFESDCRQDGDCAECETHQLRCLGHGVSKKCLIRLSGPATIPNNGENPKISPQNDRTT